VQQRVHLMVQVHTLCMV